MESRMNATPTIERENEPKTFVFLHYFGGAAKSWQWVVEQLPDHRCIAINLPGFGGIETLESLSLQSYADAVCAELKRLDIKDYTLVGHSMGGKIALQVGVSSDRPPQHIVLIAPSPPTQEPMPDEEKERLLSNHPSVENAETTLKSATRQSLSDEQRALAIQTHMDVDNAAWRWWLLEGMEDSIAKEVQHLNIPVTVLASEDDPVIPYDIIQRDVIGIIPNVRLVSIRGVGHLIPLETAGWVAAQLKEAV